MTTATVKRVDFTQTATHVLVTVYVAGAKDAKRGEHKERPELLFTNRLGEPETVVLTSVADATWEDVAEADAYKITVRLRKGVPGDKWESLLPGVAPAMKAVSPYASGKTTADWDAKTASKDADEDENDHPDAVFAKLFKNADADAQRAMKKSMFESGGTVLSDNWNDVGGRDMSKPAEGKSVGRRKS